MKACLPGFVAGLADGFDDHVQGFLVALQVGGETALVADVRGELLAVEHLLEIVEDLATAANGVGEAIDAQGHDHELLHVDVVVGMRAAVDDVHHGGRQQPGADAAQIAEQRLARVGRRGMGRGQRDAEDGVRPQLALVLGAVQVDHAAVQGGLVQGVHAGQLIGQDVVDVFDRLQHALAQIQRLVAVAKFQRLVNSGARAAGDRRAAERTVGKLHVDFDRRVSAAVENLSGMDVENLRIHDGTLLKRKVVESEIFSPIDRGWLAGEAKRNAEGGECG